MNAKNPNPHRILIATTAWLLLGIPALTQAATRHPDSPTPPATEATTPCTVPTGAPAAATAMSTSVSTGEQTPAESSAATPAPKPYLVPRNEAQHTFFVDGAYVTLLTALHFTANDSGSLNEGAGLMAGYNWTSRRGLGVGVIYSGSFFSARREGILRTATLHYFAPEFVARQRAGRRWLFREATGFGYGRYVRRYGDNRDSRGGIGVHERASVEFMATRWLGLSVGFAGEWVLTGAPDVGDGVELNLGGLVTFRIGGGLRLYF